jgi:hypothetical protein
VTKTALGGRAIQQAVTHVKPEQASKVKSWTPTRLRDGEGPGGAGKQPTDAPVLVHRGSGHGMLEKVNRVIEGGPQGTKVAPSTSSGRWSRRASDRVIVLLRLGNASGGKGPDFW